MQTVSNHPAHILNENGEVSPSSFIPFCSFGEEFIGIEMTEFNIPVCDIFKPRNYLDQLCYETDLQDLKDSNRQKIVPQLKMGLTLLLDYNEERQSYNFNGRNKSHTVKAPYHNDDHSFSLYLDAISILIKKSIFLVYENLDPVGLFGEGQYNFHSLKEISVTKSFLGLDRETIKCQNIESYNDCITRLYVRNIRQECGCLPLSLRLSEKVKSLTIKGCVHVSVSKSCDVV